MTLLLTYLTALLPVLFCAGLGFVVARRTDWLSSPTLPTLVTNIGLPALILDSMLRLESGFMALSGTLVATLMLLTLSALAGAVLLHLMRFPVRGYLSTLVNPNAGNLGIPLVYALLGPGATVYAVLISTLVQISHFTLGTALLSGRMNLSGMVRNPSILALLAGAAGKGLAVDMPSALLTTLDLLAGMALPIMLLLLGKSIASIKIRELDRLGRIVLLSASRVLLGLTCAFIVTTVWPLEDTARQALLIQAAMPAAVLSYLLASHYDGPKDDIAAIILVSTPLSLLAVLILQATLL